MSVPSPPPSAAVAARGPQRPRRGPVRVGALLGLLLAGPAAAHPFQTALYGHHATVGIDDEMLVVDVVFEEPTPNVLREYRAWSAGQPGTPAEVMARHTALRLDELAAGLQLEVDGQGAPLRRRPLDARNGVGGADFIRYRLVLEATLPPGWRQLSLHDQAHPGEALASRWDLRLAPGLRLDASSLWDGDRDRTGQWLTETPRIPARELRLAVTPLGALSRAAVALGDRLGTARAPDDAGRVAAREARAAVVDAARRRGLAAVGGPALLLLVLGGLGRWWRRRVRI